MAVERNQQSSLLRGLNPSQREAVATLSGPLLVLAGAGSGKTRVVTCRIAELIRHGTPPERILAVTFTKKAAGEMQQRVRQLLPRGKKAGTKAPAISTFHSLCVKILRRHIDRLGYPRRFAIYDRSDQESVARAVLREVKVTHALLRPGDLLAMIGRWKVRSIRPHQAGALAETDREHLAAMAYRRYQRTLKTAGAVDFDDLLLCTEELFDKYSEVRREEAARFDHLLIDEYQDTNASQYRIVKAMAAGHRNLCVVGDDDQSIYAWRGAVVRHILEFKRDWPDAKVVRLEENYRSTHEILQFANRLIGFNKYRHDKVLRAARHGGQRPRILQFPSEQEEAEGVVAEIRRRLTQPGVEPRDFAVLFRTNEQPRALETEFRRSKIPYILVGGQSFYDRKEVRDILAYLRVLATPWDEVPLLRIVNTPPRGIGQRTVQALTQRAIAEKRSVWETLHDADRLAELGSGPAAAVADFVRLIEGFRRQLGKQSMAEIAKSLIERIGYEAEVRRIYPKPEEQQSRWASVEQVVNALAAYEKGADKPALRDFLDETTLDGREFDNDKEQQLRRNAVAMLTLHAAKGLEFPHVYMVGMEEGLLPHRRSVDLGGEAIDEERRLCYVGVTRAQETLCLSLSLSRLRWGKARDSFPSRFLYEMTGQAEKAEDVLREAAAARQPARRSRKKARRRS